MLLVCGNARSHVVYVHDAWAVLGALSCLAYVSRTYAKFSSSDRERTPIKVEGDSETFVTGERGTWNLPMGALSVRVRRSSATTCFSVYSCRHTGVCAGEARNQHLRFAGQLLARPATTS